MALSRLTRLTHSFLERELRRATLNDLLKVTWLVSWQSWALSLSLLTLIPSLFPLFLSPSLLNIHVKALFVNMHNGLHFKTFLVTLGFQVICFIFLSSLRPVDFVLHSIDS